MKIFTLNPSKQNIDPLAFFLKPSNGNVAFRFKASSTQEVINTIEKTWTKLAPGQPFQYSFLDEDFGRMYSAEQRLGKIFVIFAGLAIVIACLGLFALTSFTAEQRTKEIGIRKVLGASVGSIVFLLSKEFGKLIVVAFLIAVPLGMVWRELVAEELCLQSRSRRISLCIGGAGFVPDRVGDHGLSVDQSSYVKPCQFASERIISKAI